MEVKREERGEIPGEKYTLVSHMILRPSGIISSSSMLGATKILPLL